MDVAQKASTIHSVILRPQVCHPRLVDKVNWILSQFQPSEVNHCNEQYYIKLVSLLQRIP